MAWYVPGTHPFAGQVKGMDAAIARVRRMAEQTAGTYRLNLERMFADDRGHVIVVRRATAQRADRQLDERSALFLTMTAGKITDIDECVEDLAATHEFWSEPVAGQQARDGQEAVAAAQS